MLNVIALVGFGLKTSSSFILIARAGLLFGRLAGTGGGGGGGGIDTTDYVVLVFLFN